MRFSAFAVALPVIVTSTFAYFPNCAHNCPEIKISKMRLSNCTVPSFVCLCKSPQWVDNTEQCLRANCANIDLDNSLDQALSALESVCDPNRQDYTFPICTENCPDNVQNLNTFSNYNCPPSSFECLCGTEWKDRSSACFIEKCEGVQREEALNALSHMCRY